MAYTMSPLEYRQWCRLERAERARKDRREAQRVAKQQRSGWYWAQALRFSTFKVGGLRFIKLGSLSISVCVTSPRRDI